MGMKSVFKASRTRTRAVRRTEWVWVFERKRERQGWYSSTINSRHESSSSPLLLLLLLLFAQREAVPLRFAALLAEVLLSHFGNITRLGYLDAQSALGNPPVRTSTLTLRTSTIHAMPLCSHQSHSKPTQVPFSLALCPRPTHPTDPVATGPSPGPLHPLTPSPFDPLSHAPSGFFFFLSSHPPSPPPTLDFNP